MLTCASCAVSSRIKIKMEKSKRRPFPTEIKSFDEQRASSFSRPFTAHALVEDDENSERNDNRSASENILEKMPKKLEPPQRDTGIPSELDINIDIDEGTVFRVLAFSLGFCGLFLGTVSLSRSLYFLF